MGGTNGIRARGQDQLVVRRRSVPGRRHDGFRRAIDGDDSFAQQQAKSLRLVLAGAAQRQVLRAASVEERRGPRTGSLDRTSGYRVALPPATRARRSAGQWSKQTHHPPTTTLCRGDSRTERRSYFQPSRAVKGRNVPSTVRSRRFVAPRAALGLSYVARVSWSNRGRYEVSEGRAPLLQDAESRSTRASRRKCAAALFSASAARGLSSRRVCVQRVDNPRARSACFGSRPVPAGCPAPTIPATLEGLARARDRAR